MEIIKEIAMVVTVPVVALGGAGSLDDFSNAVNKSYASAVAAGSLFVYHGTRRAVLINYPSQAKLRNIFN